MYIILLKKMINYRSKTDIETEIILERIQNKTLQGRRGFIVCDLQ